MINTRGFGVNVMPQLQAVDPSLYAFDPQKISQGALQSFQLMQAADQIKAERARQQEMAMTQQARINQQRALSELAILNAQRQGAVQGGEIEAANVGNKLSVANAGSELASLGERENLAKLQRQLAGATVQGDLASLGANQNLAKLQRELNVAKTGEELATFKQDADIQRRLREAQTAEMNANAARYLADAAKINAEIKGGGKPDPIKLDWMKGVTGMAVDFGKTAEQMAELYDSGTISKSKGIPLATELALLSKIRPEFYQDVTKGMSDELKQWLGSKSIKDFEAKSASVGSGESAPSPKAAPAKEGGPARIIIKDNGDVIRGDGDAKPQPQKQEAKVDSDGGISGLGVATTGGLAALALLSNPKTIEALKSGSSSAAKAVGRAWEGRSAAGKFTGKALKTLPKRSLAALGARGVSAAAGPVAALSLGNDLVGSALSDEFTGDLSAIEGMALAANAPSFDRQAMDAKFDELSSRINAVFRSTRLSDEQKEAELQAILDERQAVLDAMEEEDKPKKSRFMPPALLPM